MTTALGQSRRGFLKTLCAAGATALAGAVGVATRAEDTLVVTAKHLGSWAVGFDVGEFTSNAIVQWDFLQTYIALTGRSYVANAYRDLVSETEQPQQPQPPK